jgi:hypothetical protein
MPLLHPLRVRVQVEECLTKSARLMGPVSNQPDHVWKWLRLADAAGLKASLGAVARRAVSVDRAGCLRDENMQGLSPAVVKHIMRALVETGPSPEPSSPYCTNIQYSPVHPA